MKRKFMLVFLAVGFSLTLISCAAFQKEIINFDDQNALNTVSSAKQVMKHWEMNSAAIREGLGSALNEKLPVSFATAMAALDGFAKTYGKDQSKMTEPDAGRIVVLVGKLIEPLIQAIISQYAPQVWTQVLKYLPAFVAL